MPDGDNALIEWEISPDAGALLGESPVWDDRGRYWWWVDIDGRRLLRMSASGGEMASWPMPEKPGFVVLTADNVPAVGMETGIFRFDPAAAVLERIVGLDETGVRFNDATVDESGRLWAGTMDLEARGGRGVLYSVGADRRLVRVLDGLDIPNGLAADRDRDRLYLSDSGNTIRTVWTFGVDSETGGLGQRRVFAVYGEADGKPDGAALDEAGNYWSAAITGGALRVFSPQGERIAAYPTPFADPTKLAFGGAALDRIFVTSRAGPGPGGRIASARSTPAVAFRGRPTRRWRIAR